MKWVNFDVADTNYLNIMTNTDEPSQERSEKNQSEDPNPELNEENLEDELHKHLNQLIILSDELKNIGEPSRVSLTTSLQNIIESINISHSEITNLIEYRARMREYYGTSISKEDLKTRISQNPNCGANLQIREQDNLHM